MRAPIELDLHLPNFNYPGVGPEQVFDRLVIAMDDETMSPEMKARLGASMRLALAVYTHPTWTTADAYAYGLQECERTTP